MARQPVGDPAPTDGALPETAYNNFLQSGKGFSAYIHVPFCTVRCGYCDFNTYTAPELRGFARDEWAGAVVAEILFSQQVLSAGIADDASAHKLNKPFQTVFFGGGTPSLIPVADIQKVLDTLRDTFGIHKDAEITLEANPDTLSLEYLAGLKTAGINRISIGMQSAVPHVLVALDRTHNPENVRKAIEITNDVGLETSVDLIYGAPGESLEDWKTSVSEAISLGTNHISAYALIVEEGTKLHRQIRRGELPAPDDDLQAEMYEYINGALEAAGFQWYEISNWSKTQETRSKHNVAYWKGDDWWGYGPGAHSHVGGVRWWNVKHPAAWSERLKAGVSPALNREVLNVEQIYEENLLLRSRLLEGIGKSDVRASAHRALDELADEGLLEKKTTDERYVLTLTGRLLADTVILRLLT